MNVVLLLTRNGRTFRADLTPFLFGTRAENEWDESKHPRDKDGKFGKGGGLSKKRYPSKEGFYGEEFKGVKGRAAVDLLLKEKRGHVKGAFTRKDLGDIDLVWGTHKIGLAHIVKRRTEKHQDLEALLDEITDIIETGELSKGKRGRWNVTKGKRMAVFKTEYDGEEALFVLTAFERTEEQ